MDVNEQSSGVCPEPEQLAAYVDGRVTAEERAAIQRHLADCEDCREVVADAVRLRDESETRVLPFWRRRKTRAIGGGILALAASLILVVQVRPELNPFRRPTPYDELVAAVGTNRAVEGRLTGGFRYGPLRAPTRGAEIARDNYDVLAAVARIKRVADQRSTAQNLHALGVAQITVGDVDSGVRTLEHVAEKEPGNARFQSDLATAYMARARLRDQAEDNAKALAATERALKADPALAEAYFNRALALEAMSLPDAAKHAWTAFLKLESSSGWAEEARRHLSSSGAPVSRRVPERLIHDAKAASDLAAEFPQQAREVLEDRLLPAWAEALERGDDAQVKMSLELARTIATSVDKRRSNKYLIDLVRCLSASDAKRRSATVAGLRAYARGREATARDDVARSSSHFEQAERQLAIAGCPLSLAGRYHRVAALINGGKDAEATAALVELERHAEKSGYSALVGLARWKIGLVHSFHGRLTDSLASYRAAKAAFESVDESEHAANMDSLVAEGLRALGRTSDAWTHHQSALHAIRTGEDHRIRHQVLVQSSLTAMQQGLPETALHFQDAVIANARAWGYAPAEGIGRLQRAKALSAMHEWRRSHQELQSARRLTSVVPDRAFAARFEIELASAEAQLEAIVNPTAAIQAVDRTLELLATRESAPDMPELLFLRGLAKKSIGRLEGAEKDFDAAISIIDEHRPLIEDELHEISFAEVFAAGYRAMISLQASERRDPASAFAIAERMRARTLLGVMSGSDQRTLTVSDVVQSLPSNTAVVAFVVMPESTLSWILRSNGWWHVQLDVRSETLDRHVDMMRTAMIMGDRSRAADASLWLYRTVWAPLRPYLTGVSTVAVVPDGSLAAVPFSALTDGTRRTVQDYAIVAVPSASVLLVASRQLDERWPRNAPPERAAAFGVSRAEGLASSLPVLPFAEREASVVAGLYPGGRAFLATDATKAAFIAEAGHYQVVHFAGHAISNRDNPWLSWLAFSADNDPASSLLGTELRKRPFRRTALVVLSACDTGSGKTYRTEGAFNLARLFLASGVPSVLASLWPVDDAAANRLVLDFHRRLRSGGDPVQALAGAQRAALVDENPEVSDPRHWGAWTVIGGIRRPER